MAKSTKKKPDIKLKALRVAKPKSNAKPKAKTKAKAKVRITLPVVPAGPVGDHDAAVLDRLWSVIMSRRDADPSVSHSARLLSRGTAKVAQKFGEEAVECLIEAVAGNREALIAESADVLYHLLVVWVSSGVAPHDVWAELIRREGISGIAEKASRSQVSLVAPGPQTSKIP